MDFCGILSMPFSGVGSEARRNEQRATATGQAGQEFPLGPGSGSPNPLRLEWRSA